MKTLLNLSKIRIKCGDALRGEKTLATFLILGLCMHPPYLRAAEIFANSPQWLDVSNAVLHAQSGDTVLVPAGTAIWTNGLTITGKGITLRGAGYYVYTGGPTLSNATGQETIIIDQIENRRNPIILTTWTNTQGMFRLSGFHFQGSTNTGVNYIGTIYMRGSVTSHGTNNSKWRIDHCYFNKLQGRPGIYAFSGLIDNNYFDQGGQAGIIFDGRIPDPNEKGHWSWATDVRMGTVDEGVYVENNYFTNNAIRGATDGFTGARFVFRYNRTDNAAVQTHGTDSTGVFRGTRWVAAYGNHLNSYLRGDHAVHFRSGTGVVFSNHVTGSFPGVWRGLNYRTRDQFTPYGGANGTNAFDENSSTLYATGTHTGTNGATVLVDANANWTPNEWEGYTLINDQSGRFGMVSTNTAATMTVFGSAFNQHIYWTNGNSYQLRRVIRVLDGVGMGRGDLLVGGSQFTPPTPTQWPKQADDPVYIWANTGITNVSTSGDATIVAGRNYTNVAHPTYIPLVFPHPFAEPEQEQTTIITPRNLRSVP